MTAMQEALIILNWNVLNPPGTISHHSRFNFTLNILPNIFINPQ
jgi:hypothetical protein